ncbi:MAG: HAMP domain-containing sensor histidine kinase [Bacteroidota bacterium]
MKLIDRYTRSYIGYAGIMLAVTIPVLYFSVQFLVARRIDQNLLRQKKMIVSSISNIAPNEPFTHTIFLEPGLSFSPAVLPITESDKFSVVQHFDTTDNDYEPWRVLTTTVYIHRKPYLLELSSSLLDKEELIAGIVLMVGIILLLFMTGLFAINRSLSVNIWKPFYRTIGMLNNYKIEKDEVLFFEKIKVDEFAELNTVIHSLTARNAEVFESQKSFIENVSHEMQTPVAIQQVKLELLLQTQPLSAAQYRLIADLMDNTQQAGILHNCMLLLAKIDNRQFRDAELFSASAIVENLVEQYALQADLKKIVVNLALAGDIQVQANKGLIEVMIGNLLNNAIRHNSTGGSVQISSSKNSIAFTNSAADGPLDENTLFQRFHGKSALNGGTGLGLHIAKKIADLYEFGLRYDFVSLQHRFTLTFL